jgi:hypothetical protein
MREPFGNSPKLSHRCGSWQEPVLSFYRKENSSPGRMVALWNPSPKHAAMISSDVGALRP